MVYQAPVADIAYSLKYVTGLKNAIDDGHFSELSADLCDAILEEAGRFANNTIAGLAKEGDRFGTPFIDGEVQMPPGWKEAYHSWVDSGWGGLTGPESAGGQNLPIMLAVAAMEMWNSGSLAFAIGPILTYGAVEAMQHHASEELKAKYLEKLVSGEWMATMNLTEPQAGSDLNALCTKAILQTDGTYKITGTKIFITYGEHDLTENIAHLVLARLPDAPPGTRGISLFLAPKFFVNDDGSLGSRNDLRCAGVEHKLGLHASPTCSMVFGENGGAVGWLIGEENRGLACMFTMMNSARLMVGIQGVAVAESAFQQAFNYASDRRQGRAPDTTSEGMSPIVEHPDIRRTLLCMKTLTRAARLIAYSCAHAIDLARCGDDEQKKFWSERANLLTPVAKAFSSDIGVEVANMGVQVHGGMGYIEETGAARLLRDARIAPIYEGTNGIQAIDLVSRKLPQSGGDCLSAFLEEMEKIVSDVEVSNHPDLSGVSDRLRRALGDLQETSHWLQAQNSEGQISEILCGATSYLRLFGITAGSILLARAALLSKDQIAGSDLSLSYIATARYAAFQICPETVSLRRIIAEGANTILDVRVEALAV